LPFWSHDDRGMVINRGVKLMKRILFIMMMLASAAAQAAESGPVIARPPVYTGSAAVDVGGNPVSVAMIEMMPMRQSTMANPWSPQGALWMGVRLADFVQAHGLAGRDIILRARDNYTIRLRAAEIAGDEPLLATRMDGAPLDPTTTGPLMLIWPAQAEQVMAKTAPDANWIWGIVEIKAAP